MPTPRALPSVRAAHPFNTNPLARVLLDYVMGRLRHRLSRGLEDREQGVEVRTLQDVFHQSPGPT